MRTHHCRGQMILGVAVVAVGVVVVGEVEVGEVEMGEVGARNTHAAVGVAAEEVGMRRCIRKDACQRWRAWLACLVGVRWLAWLTTTRDFCRNSKTIRLVRRGITPKRCWVAVHAM